MSPDGSFLESAQASWGKEIETSKVHVTAVEQVKRARFEQHLVEEVDIVDLPAGHINTGRNAAAHVQESMQLDRTFVAAKLPPGKERQAQIDGGRVEGIHRLGQVHAERFLVVEVAGEANQLLGKV